MIPCDVCGSRFPVGSSASRISGRFTNARATATRCCSPPESSLGRLSRLVDSPTRSSTWGTWLATTWRGRPMTSSAKATFSNTVLFGSSRKSWKTQPMLRRRYGTRHLGRSTMLRPASRIWPRVGQLLTQQQPDEGRLARARGADEEDELPLVDLDVDVAQRDARTALVRLADVLKTNHLKGRHEAKALEGGIAVRHPRRTGTRS